MSSPLIRTPDPGTPALIRYATSLASEVPNNLEVSTSEELVQWGYRHSPLTLQQTLAMLMHHMSPADGLDPRPHTFPAIRAVARLAEEGCLQPGVLNSVLTLMWWGRPEHVLGRERWMRLADTAGRPGAPGTSASRKYMNRITLFRGSLPEQTCANTGEGMTWTTNAYLASIYAFERHPDDRNGNGRQPGTVYRALVPPSRILFGKGCAGICCQFQEYVVDIKGLDIEVFALHTDARPGLWPEPRRRNYGMCSCTRP